MSGLYRSTTQTLMRWKTHWVQASLNHGIFHRTFEYGVLLYHYPLWSSFVIVTCPQKLKLLFESTTLVTSLTRPRPYNSENRVLEKTEKFCGICFVAMCPHDNAVFAAWKCIPKHNPYVAVWNRAVWKQWQHGPLFIQSCFILHEASILAPPSKVSTMSSVSMNR